MPALLASQSGPWLIITKRGGLADGTTDPEGQTFRAENVCKIYLLKKHTKIIDFAEMF